MSTPLRVVAFVAIRSSHRGDVRTAAFTVESGGMPGAAAEEGEDHDH